MDLAFQWAGGTTLAMCEIDPFCRKVLHKHWPLIPIFKDVKELTGDKIRGVLMPAERNEKYDEAVRLYEMGLSVREVADYFQVTHQCMWKALRRRTTLRPQKQEGESNVFYRGGSSSSERAHKIVDNAIRYGKLINPHVCECCGCTDKPHKNGASDIQAHHDDYNYPLQVRWLCQKCHFEWHRAHRAKEVIVNEGTFNETKIDIVYGGFPC